MTPAELNALLDDVRAYATKRGGKIYAPVCHPAFKNIPSEYGHERFNLIRPHIRSDMHTALDIGSHWGYFAHRLEQLGLEVTAAENMSQYLRFLYRIRELYGGHFEVWPHSVFELPLVAFDVVIAFNIFHHFIKTEGTYKQLVDFLSRLECRVMFFQAHDPDEEQMSNAHINFTPEQFVRFLLENTRLSAAERIGSVGSRPVFILE